MRTSKPTLIIVFLLAFMLTELRSQKIVASSGDNVSGIGGTVSYTVGQVLYTTNTGTTGTIAQGVQQPYEIIPISGIAENLNISVKCAVFPNPAENFLALKLENWETKNFSYQLTDLNGKILQSNNLESNESLISLENLLPSIYFLNVIQENTTIKTFKIIKK
jgi:hypothetical protein